MARSPYLARSLDALWLRTGSNRLRGPQGGPRQATPRKGMCSLGFAPNGKKGGSSAAVSHSSQKRLDPDFLPR
jgi:hypothetical protein